MAAAIATGLDSATRKSSTVVAALDTLMALPSNPPACTSAHGHAWSYDSNRRLRTVADSQDSPNRVRFTVAYSVCENCPARRLRLTVIQPASDSVHDRYPDIDAMTASDVLAAMIDGTMTACSHCSKTIVAGTECPHCDYCDGCKEWPPYCQCRPSEETWADDSPPAAIDGPDHCTRCGRDDDGCDCHHDDCGCEVCTTAIWDRFPITGGPDNRADSGESSQAKDA